MAVEGTEIADVHALEYILLMRNSRLEGICQADESAPAVVFQQSHFVQPACNLEAHGIVGLIGVERQKVFLHATDSTVDRHVIVVEDDEDVIV